jgi:DNA polymerase-1
MMTGKRKTVLQKKLLAIDGNSLIHRAYWALPQMSDQEGRPTNAVYGFLSMLFKMAETYEPTHIIVAFDKKGPTFRHKMFDEYKAGRKPTPDDLKSQIPLLKDALLILGIRSVEAESYEADDILGTLSRLPDTEKYIVTGDRDALQLISDSAFVVLTKKGVTEVKQYGTNELKSEYGLAPSQIVDLKSLMGDASDNIPGVPGVGEKTALKLIGEFGTLDNLYDHLGDLPLNKLREKLEANRESAMLSRRLAEIDTNVPMERDLETARFSGFDAGRLRKMCEKYDFRSFLKRFDAAKSEPEVKTRQIVREDIPKEIGKGEFALLIGEDAVRIAVREDEDLVLPLKKTLIDEGNDLQEILDALEPLLDGKIVVHDVKGLMHLLGKIIPDAFDVMIAAWVIDPSFSKYDIESLLTRERLPAGAASLLKLAKAQRETLYKNGLAFIYGEVEMPLAGVLFEMEKAGFYVSEEALRELKGKYESEIDALTQKIYAAAGREFNINSPKQLGKVLFEDLGLAAGKKKKTGYSTDIEVLENLADSHEIVNMIIDFRQVSKLKNTYVDGLLALVKNGYVHTTFLQTAAATGRLSSVEPNLQNIPIKTDMAQDIRRAFIAPEGCSIVSADYSQIELRILAHIAQDEHLMDAFKKGQDIHARTAAEILGKEIADVTGEERNNAKAVNFGIVYGISDFGLARNIGITRKRAGEYINRYFAEFSGVKRYMDNIILQAHEDGFVRSLWGRIRYLKELSSHNYNIRSFGERAALNSPIQGSAADIIKIAMIKAAEKLKSTSSRMVLQVHDELIVYARKGEEDIVRGILKDCMEHAVKISVPLAVHVSRGHTWAEAK